MTPEIEQAFRDWLADRACLDSGGRNYRLKVKDDRGFTLRYPPAPWNKSVKRAFADCSAFHRAAHLWQEQIGSLPPPPQAESKQQQRERREMTRKLDTETAERIRSRREELEARSEKDLRETLHKYNPLAGYRKGQGMDKVKREGLIDSALRYEFGPEAVRAYDEVAA